MSESKELLAPAPSGACAVPVRERPILFSPAMVREILAGQKTQTRRVVSKAFDGCWAGSVHPARESGWIAWWPGHEPGLAEFTKKAYERGFPCPHGAPGDRLWVRETFALQHDCDGDMPPHRDNRPIRRWFDDEGCDRWQQAHYRATDPPPDLCCESARCRCCGEGEPGPHWKPSIHMPRWASRITLEITDVRVQRVQEISEEDAIAEGVTKDRCGKDPAIIDRFSYRDGFAFLWDSINRKRGYGWEKNPWVWCIGFRRIDDTAKGPAQPPAGGCASNAADLEA